MADKKKRTDAQIMDGSPVVTTFNEVEYIWRQRPRREQRKLREDLMRVTGHVAVLETLDGVQQIGQILPAINSLLEFCEDWNEDMDADMDEIEAHIQTSGLGSVTELFEKVYTPIFQAWLEPWVTGSTKAKKKKQSKASTKNRNSTK